MTKRYLVTDSGIEEIDRRHPDFEGSDRAVFSLLDEAKKFEISVLRARIEYVEQKIEMLMKSHGCG